MNSSRSLLTSEERIICEQISQSGEGLYGQRARALLALNEGLTQVRAGELAGLTNAQVGQCLESFRQLRTAGIYSVQADSPVVQSEQKFSSQLGVTDSNIEDSVTQLKQTQSEMKRNRAVITPDPELYPTGEVIDSNDNVNESNAQPGQAQDNVTETGTSERPQKNKNGRNRKKIKNPKKKTKKPKKPKKLKIKNPKKRKKRKKKKKQKK